MLNLSHKNLEVYKISLMLLKEIYILTNKFPKEEQYNLVSQLRRAAVSVCSNIAEGAARISAKEKKRFYEIARASLVEVDTQFEISLLLEYLTRENIIAFEKFEESVFRMLSKMINNLNDSSHLPKTTSH
ncbi:MAG: four helix bundle protein [Sphingobacteriales bacterium]|nr:MAG: four helix bundle protein [Sphingobacteriales bacterium]